VHVNLTTLGAMHASLGGIANELNWSVERLRAALAETAQQGMVRYDEKARFIWLVNFLKYNTPESPNVVKSWETALSYLPECRLREDVIVHVRLWVAGLSPAFQEALPPEFQKPNAPSVNVDETLSPLPERPLANAHNLIEGVPTRLSTVSTPPPPSAKVCETGLSPSQKPLAHPVNLAEGDNTRFSDTNRPFLKEFKAVSPLSESDLTPAIFLSEGDHQNDFPLPESLSIKHKALSIKHTTVSIQEEEIVQETRSKEIISIVEEKNIVAPARQKMLSSPDANLSDVAQVFSYWQQTLQHPQAQLDPKRRKVIKNALASGYTVAQLQNAILGCSLTPHNMGDNEQGQRYDGLHVILRDADQIDRFIRNCHNPPRRRTKADQLLADNLAAGQRWLASFEPEEKIIDETE
jgi:hypothetical protein